MVSSVAAQESPEGKPEGPPIPAIPGVPSMRVTAPTFKPSPATTTGSAMPRQGTAAPVKAERLRPEFQPGLTYRFVVKTELRTGGRSFAMEQQARFDAKVRVDGKPGIVLKGRTERLDATLSSGGATLSYRSLEPGDQGTPLGKHLRVSLNRSVDLTLDAKGRVDGSQVAGGGDESALLPGMPSFGPEELEQIVAGLPQAFSEKPVAPGDQWTVQGSRPVGEAGLVEFEIACRHVGQVAFEGHLCDAVEFAGVLSGALPNGGAAAEIESGGIEGRLHYDPLDRMVRHSEQTSQLVVARPAEGGDPGQVERLPIHQTSTLRLLHVVPTP